MEKYGAAGPRFPRPDIVIEDENKIVLLVLPPDRLVPPFCRQANGPIVLRACNIIAPAVGAKRSAECNLAKGPPLPVGADISWQNPEFALWRSTVAFPFGKSGAAAPDHAGNGERAGQQFATAVKRRQTGAARSGSGVPPLAGGHHELAEHGPLAARRFQSRRILHVQVIVSVPNLTKEYFAVYDKTGCVSGRIRTGSAQLPESKPLPGFKPRQISKGPR